MDYDRNHFLTDVFETVLKMRGDPVKNLDAAVNEVIEDHVKELKKLAQEEREHLLTMYEERRKHPFTPARTLWRYASGPANYDRRR
jgi:hypothetical protein